MSYGKVIYHNHYSIPIIGIIIQNKRCHNF